MSTGTVSPNSRRFLSADGLIKTLRQRFEGVADTRRTTHLTHSMADTLMSVFAMFSLKDSSMLAFGERQDDLSLKNVFGIKQIPSDSKMRDILDPIEVDQLNEAFADVFAELQRGGVLKRFQFLGNQYLVAIDGTGYFCSSSVRCEHVSVRRGHDFWRRSDTISPIAPGLSRRGAPSTCLCGGASMISISTGVRIFLYRGVTDMRRSFNGSSGMVAEHFDTELLSGHLFLFFNRRRDSIKRLHWDRDGLVIWYKRLEPRNLPIAHCPREFRRDRSN